MKIIHLVKPKALKGLMGPIQYKSRQIGPTLISHLLFCNEITSNLAYKDNESFTHEHNETTCPLCIRYFNLRILD